MGRWAYCEDALMPMIYKVSCYVILRLVISRSDGLLLLRTPLLQELVVYLAPPHAVDQLLPLLQVQRVFQLLTGLYFLETVLVAVLDYAHLLLQLGSPSAQHKRQSLLLALLLQLHREPPIHRVAPLLPPGLPGEGVHVAGPLLEEDLLVFTLTLLHPPVLQLRMQGSQLLSITALTPNSRLSALSGHPALRGGRGGRRALWIERVANEPILVHELE